MVPSCIQIHADVRLVGGTVPVAELLAVIFLVERSVGLIHSHSDCKCVCVCVFWQGQDRTAERGAHVTLWSRLQQALSRHQGAVEISWCKAHFTSDNFHQFDLTPEILVGNAVADALAKKGASVFLAANDWVKICQDRMGCSTAHVCHQYTCCSGCSTKCLSAHPEDVLLAARRASGNVNAPSWKTPPRTHWSLWAKGIIAMCVKTLHQPVVRWFGSEAPFA